MDRNTVLLEIKSRVTNENLVKHMLATEAVMRALARRLGEAEEEWGLAGLIHDIDIEDTEGNMDEHSKVGAEMAKEMGASDAVVHAVLVHNEQHGRPLLSHMDKALFSADPLTGLITASALVRPDKRLGGLNAASVMKRFGEKRFAAGANREQINTCKELGLQTEELVALGLAAMQCISSDLGL
ncbi:MAG: HDIG domain-containing protein [Chloroflexi bacterium]|nr:HDIG domain-containing protein [Chloroflexota bacterium]